MLGAFVVPIQTATSGLTPAFWITLAVTLVPGVVVLALMTLLRKELRGEFAAAGDVEHLSADMAKVRQEIKDREHGVREAFTAEFGRMRDSIDRNRSEVHTDMAELRGMLAKALEGIQAVKDENVRVKHAFELYKLDIEHRLEAVEQLLDKRAG